MAAKFYARTVFFVRDASRSLEFYTKELGFSLDWSYEEQGKPHVFQASLHGFEMALVHWGDPTIAIYDPDQNEIFFWMDHASRNPVERREILWNKVLAYPEDVAAFDRSTPRRDAK